MNKSVIGILVFAFGIRLVGLNQSFWLDEAAQVIESRRPLSEQLNIKADFWPPLYHLLLHFWMQLNTSEIWIRSLSLFFGLISIWLCYKIASKLFNERVGIWSATLLALSPFHVWYSQEARPYMLTVALGMVATWFLLQKKWLVFFLTVAALLYSTYIAGFLLFAHAVYVWINARKDFKSFVTYVGLSLLSLLPWLPKLFEQLGGGRKLVTVLPGWSEAVSTPQWTALPLTFAKFTLGRVSFTNDLFYGIYVALLLIICLFLFGLAWKKEAKSLKILGIFFGLPLLLAWLFSFWLPIFAPQRLLFILPFFYIAMSASLIAIKKGQKLILAIFIAVSVYSLYLYTKPQFQREHWREAVAYVETEAIKQPSLVMFVFPDTFAPWQWYSHGSVPALAVAPNFQITSSDLLLYASQVKQVDKIYFFHYLTDLTDPQKLVPHFLASLGYSEVMIKDFPGAGFISIYEKSLAYN